MPAFLYDEDHDEAAKQGACVYTKPVPFYPAAPHREIAGAGECHLCLSGIQRGMRPWMELEDPELGGARRERRASILESQKFPSLHCPPDAVRSSLFPGRGRVVWSGRRIAQAWNFSASRDFCWTVQPAEMDAPRRAFSDTPKPALETPNPDRRRRTKHCVEIPQLQLGNPPCLPQHREVALVSA